MEETVLDVARRRAELLDTLRDGPMDKRALASRVEASRSTVDRAIRTLSSYGLVREEGGAFETTATGVLALSRVREYAADARAIERAGGSLAPLWKETPISVAFLRGAEHRLLGEVTGVEAVSGLRSALRNATSVRAVLPDAVGIEHLEVLYSQAVAGETDVEVLCSERLFEALAASYPGWLRGIVEDGGARVGTAAVPSYALFCCEFGTRESARLLVFDDGRPHAVVSNDAPAAVEWAAATVDAVAASATDRRERAADLDEAASFDGAAAGPVLGEQTASAREVPAPLAPDDGEHDALLGAGYAVDDGRLRTPAFGASGACTVALWLRPTNVGTDWQVAVKWDYLVVAIRRDRFFGAIYDPDVERQRALVDVAASTLREGEWQHVAYAYDESLARLYVDGERVASTEDDYPVDVDAMGAAVGYHYVDRDSGVHTPDFRGQIADARFYEEALSGEVVERLYRTTAPHRGRGGADR